jgi:hypothetical protein
MLSARNPGLAVHGGILGRVTCDYCAAALFGRSDRRFCDATCRARWHARERRREDAGVWLDELVDVMTRPGARSFAELVRSSWEVVRT